MKHWHVSVILLLAVASAVWSSGIIPAIIPAAVPAANKQGNGSLFQLSTGSVTSGHCTQFDANGNTVDAGSACGSGGSTAGASLFSSTASATVTQTSATTLIGAVTGSTTIAANTFTAGQVLHIFAEGYYSTPATPASLTIDLKIGGTARVSTGAVVQIASVTTGTWRLNCIVTTRTAGAGGTQIANCTFEETGPTLTPGESPMQTSSAWSIDTTATQAIDIAATWSTATGAPTITSTNVAAWIPGAPVTSVFTLTGAIPNLSGDATTSGSAVTTVGKVNGVAYASSPSTNTTPVITASNTATYTSLPSCADSGGNHLNYNTSTHVFSCGTSGGSTAVTYFIRQSGAASASTLAMGINVVSGNYLFVMTGTNTAYPTIADTLSSTFTAITNATSAGGNFGKMWVALLASSGADTITLTGGSSQNVAAIEMVPPAGFAGTVDNFASNIVAGGPVSITVSQANDFLVCATAWDHGSVIPMSLAPCNVAAHANSSDGITIGYSVLPLANTTVWVGFSASSGNSGDGITIAASLK